MALVHPCPMPRCQDPQDPGNAPLVTTPLCDAHTASFGRQLGEVPGLYVDLELALVAEGQGEGEYVSRGEKAPPIPMNVTARALQEDLVRLVTTAEDELRLALGLLPRPRRGREGVNLAAAVGWLNVRQDQLLAHTFGTTLAVDLDWRVYAIRRALGLTKLVHRLPAPCPSCDNLTLRRDDGASVVRCVNSECRRTFMEEDYARLVLILASSPELFQ